MLRFAVPSPRLPAISRFLSRAFQIATVLSISAHLQAQTIPAFPGAEGYGAYAVGGRNGDVYHITNLNASGTGSFADAIATAPTTGRTIVFDVSGYIRFPSGSNGVRLTNSKITIAGQTAPGDGVGFYNNFFRISGDDVVVRHLRFRMGKNGSGGDCIDLDSGCLNAILDHVSMEFSTDENMSSFGSPPENLTLQYSLNAWGLESHSCGGLWDQNHATSHHNLWAHNHTRNPKSRPSGLLEWVNNVTFDWDIGFIMGDTQSVQNYKANVINSYFLCPPGNTQSKALVKASLATNGQPNFTVFLSGNLMDNDGDSLLNGVDKGYGIVEGSSYVQAPSAIAGSTAGVATDNALTAYKKVVSSAGALRLDAGYTGTLRDEVDTILLTKLVNQQAFHVTRESATGASNNGFGTLASTATPIDTDQDGMPDYYETALGWNAALDDHKTALASSGGLVSGTTFFPANTPAGYTRLEEYLQFLAIPHGTVPRNVSGTPTSLQVDLRRYTAGFSNAPTFTVANAVGGMVAQSGPGSAVVTFTPTLNYTGRARFEFTVTDAQASTWTQTFAAVVSASGLPRDQVWRGDNATNTWDTTANNWSRGGTPDAFGTGDYATFNDTGSLSPGVNVAAAGVTASSVVVDAGGNYTFGGTGGITTSGPLVKRGTGTVTFVNPNNSFASATVEAGNVTLGVGGSLLGNGKFTLLDGASFSNVYTNTQPTVAMPFEVPTGSTTTINTGNRLILSGALTGGGTVNYNVQTTVSRADFTGPLAAFTGRINFTGSGGARLFFNGGSFNGFDGASVDLGGSVNLQPQTNSGGNALKLGALSGLGAGAQLTGGTAGAVAFTVGSLNTDTSFAGSLVGNATLAKTGTGTLTLAGTNTYTGATSVGSGGLLVGGSLASTPVTVASGALLGGSGTLAGAVSASAGSFLSPGTLPFTGATMTVGGGLALGGATLYYDLSSSPTGANDRIVMNNGTLAFSGTQFFQFLLLEGVLNPGNYDLITGAAATTGTATFTHNLPTGTRQTFNLTLAGNTVRLAVTGVTASLVWTGVNNGGTWDAQSTANWSGGPTATFFNGDTATFDDTSANGNVTITGNVAPRVVTFNNTTTAYTLAGDALTGGGQLVKSGSGPLTVFNDNTYSGGTTINAGATVTLGNDTANNAGLGTGSVTLNGGTLSMFSNANSYNAAVYDLVVPAGQTGRLNADARCDLSGRWLGGGTFNFYVPFVRTTLFNDASAFTGVINVLSDADGGDLRMGTSYAYPGFPLATVNLTDRVSAYYTGTLANGAGTTIEIGELAGTPLSTLLGGATGGRNFTYRIGGKTLAGAEAVFGGTIAEQGTGLTTSLVKTGAGVWKLTGACAYNGGTTVEQGTLRVAGSLACGGEFNVQGTARLDLASGTVGADSLTIAANASLTGNGTVNGDLTNNGTITSGAGGQLTFNGDVVNNGTIRLTGGTALVATGAFVNNGVLDLLTGGGGLPPNLVNNGTVIDSSAVRVQSANKSGNSFTATIQSYVGHNYQLQAASDLGASATWQPVGAAQAGSGNVLTFTDGGASGTKRFYRVVVSP